LLACAGTSDTGFLPGPRELLAERGIEFDHVALYRWVQRFSPLLIDAARPCRHLVADRWFVDETYVKVSGFWSYVHRAVDQHGQVIDVYVARRRDITSARTFFTAALAVTRDISRPPAPSTDSHNGSWKPPV
jgi:transposase, IS6 family